MTPPLDFRWRRSPDAPITVSAAAFARLVAENDLKPIEVDGYLWAWLPTEDGYDTYRAYGPKWAYLYQSRRVLTQDNVAGGALVLRANVPTGMTARLVQATHVGPVTNSANRVRIQDEDAAESLNLASAAAANATFRLPTIGSAATSTGNYPTSELMVIGPGQYLAFMADAAAQTETMTVAVTLLLPISAASDGSDITWSTTGSAGTPNLAASTISAANTMQAVLLP